LAEWLQAGGIDIQVVFQPDEGFTHETPDWNPYLGNDYVAKIQRQFEGRVLGLATIQAWHQPNRTPGSLVTANPALEELERCILDLGLRGLRINPLQHNYQFNNQNITWPLLERLSELQKQAGRKMLVSVYAYGDSLHNSPEALSLTAARFPDLLFLMQHSGFVWGYETVNDMVAGYENLLLDLSAMPQQAIVREAYENLGPQRFCIGTDGPQGTFLLKEAILVDFARSDAERELLLGLNLARRLGLSPVTP
jgi:predicted TIM-barrel fold metal-dependent hydrolase